MRAIGSSIMAALIVGALLWGNCLSCPQLLLLSRQSAPAHACCHEKSMPKTPGARQCQSQGLGNFIKSDPRPEIHLAVATAGELPVPFVPVAALELPVWLPEPLYSPPGDPLPLRI